MGEKRVRAFQKQKPATELVEETYDNFSKEMENELLEELQREKGKHSYFSCGRPETITPKIQLLLLQAFSMGCTDKQALAFCAKNGYIIPESTFYAYIDRHKDFKSKRDAAKENPILLAKGSVLNALANDPKLALEYLKSKCSREFRQGVELSGVVGGATVSVEQIKELKNILESDEDAPNDYDGQENSGSQD